MTATTESASAQAKTKKEGVQVKGKDFVYLNAPEIRFPENAPLHNTDKRELYAMLDELFQGGSEGGDDWQPPEMPEPSDYEIYLLVEVVDVSDRYTSNLEIMVSSPENASTGYGPLSVDWGDGTTDEWNEGMPVPGYPDYYKWSRLSHNYTEVGRYLVKIFGTEYSCFLQRITPTGGMQYNKVLCAKLGSEVVVNHNNRSYTSRAFIDQRRLQYIKMSGKGGLPWETIGGCRALKRIDIAISPREIYGSQFNGCGNLQRFDFTEVTQIPDYGLNSAGFSSLDLPNCVSIGNYGVQNCQRLSKVYAPNCKFVGDYAFANCYNLQEIIVAEDCIFGNNCFTDCFSLFPRPDGSVN